MSVRTTLKERVAVVQLDRPPANAMEPDFLHDIAACFHKIEADSSVGAVVVHGTGGTFSAGMDLKLAAELDADGSDRIVQAFNAAFAAVYGLMKPVIAAVNGHAIAGGMVLALCCDYRIGVDRDGLFGLTEVRVGVPFPEVAYNVIADQLPPDTLRKMIQFGQNMSPAQALSCGALDELVAPDLVLERAIGKATECLAIPPRGYADVKHQLRGAVISRNAELVEQGQDGYLGRWLDDDARQAARDMLESRRAP